MSERSSGKRVKPGEKWIAVRIPDWAEDRLRTWAQRRDVSISHIIRRLVLEALDNDRDQSGGVP